MPDRGKGLGDPPSHSLTRGIGGDQLRKLFFKGDQLFHKPVELKVTDRRGIQDVVIVIMLFQLGGEFPHAFFRAYLIHHSGLN
jgi:hypothetical protein